MSYPPTHPDNPYYYGPGITLYDPDRNDKLNKEGTELAHELLTGNTTFLPQGVLDFLLSQRDTLNTADIGQHRKEIADAIGEPPYTPEQAMDIGAKLLHLIESSTEKGIQLGLVQMDNMDIWGE